MKKPAKPKTPRKPSEPKLPLKEYPYTINHSIQGEGRLVNLLPEGVRPEDLVMEHTGYDGGYEIYYEARGVRPNHHYKQEMKAFQERYAKYVEKLKVYEEKMESMREELDQYEKDMAEYEKFKKLKHIEQLKQQLKELENED